MIRFFGTAFVGGSSTPGYCAVLNRATPDAVKISRQRFDADVADRHVDAPADGHRGSIRLWQDAPDAMQIALARPLCPLWQRIETRRANQVVDAAPGGMPKTRAETSAVPANLGKEGCASRCERRWKRKRNANIAFRNSVRRSKRT